MSTNPPVTDELLDQLARQLAPRLNRFAELVPSWEVRSGEHDRQRLRRREGRLVAELDQCRAHYRQLEAELTDVRRIARDIIEELTETRRELEELPQ